MNNIETVSGDEIFTREIIKNSLAALGEEMFHAMKRASMSPIIYEALDFGIGVTDAAGRLIAQGNGIPGFVGMLDGAVQEVIKRYKSNIHDGDIFITNDPYLGGGTHLSDVTLVKPVFVDNKLIAWTACKAHWTEIGGAFPGSFSAEATEIYQEGLQFSVVRLFSAGTANDMLIDVLRTNVRLPEMTIGDMWSSVAALNVGEQRFLAIVEKYGKSITLRAIEALLNHGERMVAASFKTLPQGDFFASNVLDDDGQGNGPLEVRVKVTITQEKFIVDFTGTASTAAGSINCTRPTLEASAREVFMGVVEPNVPATEGCFRRLEVICPDDTVLTARRPAAVSNYFESMVAAADVIRMALATVLPNRLTAGQFGSVCSMTMAGHNPATGNPFILVQPLVGGWGANIDKDGENAQFCVGNGETCNIPVEIQEARYGVRIERYGFHDAPAGNGRHRGGRGVVLEYRILEDNAELSLCLGRDETPPAGIDGGEQGSCNQATIIRANGLVDGPYGMKGGIKLKKGDLVRIVTGHGGGWGQPELRSSTNIKADVENGFACTKDKIC